jgi:hypothetical protein
VESGSPPRFGGAESVWCVPLLCLSLCSADLLSCSCGGVLCICVDLLLSLSAVESGANLAGIQGRAGIFGLCRDSCSVPCFVIYSAAVCVSALLIKPALACCVVYARVLIFWCVCVCVLRACECTSVCLCLCVV